MTEITPNTRDLNNEMSSRNSQLSFSGTQQLSIESNETEIDGAEFSGVEGVAAAASPNFSQIRKKFEEKCKLEQKRKGKAAFLATQEKIAGSSSSNRVDEAKKISELSSEFQDLYPSFKEFFTKRQFVAIETYFHLADMNQDGFLEAKELKQLMIDSKQSINLCDADIIVSIGDQDQDGKLSPKEFLQLCKPSAEMLREQQHIEGSFLPSNLRFAEVIVQKLKSFASPVSSRVKGTRQFFENFTGNTGKPGGRSKTRKPLVNIKYKNHARPLQQDEADQRSGVKYMVENFEAASQTSLPIQFRQKERSDKSFGYDMNINY